MGGGVHETNYGVPMSVWVSSSRNLPQDFFCFVLFLFSFVLSLSLYPEKSLSVCTVQSLSVRLPACQGDVDRSHFASHRVYENCGDNASSANQFGLF